MAIMTQSFRLNADTEIPAVGFGTYLISPHDTASAVCNAIKHGYRHIDTAAVYENEEAVGAGIREGIKAVGLSRKDIFVTTKLWPGNQAGGEQAKSGQQTIKEFESSLAKLGLDYVDLYLIHSPHGGAKRIDQWKAGTETNGEGS